MAPESVMRLSCLESSSIQRDLTRKQIICLIITLACPDLVPFVAIIASGLTPCRKLRPMTDTLANHMGIMQVSVRTNSQYTCLPSPGLELEFTPLALVKHHRHLLYSRACLVPRYSKWGNFTRPIYACIELSLLFRDRQSTYIPIVFVLQWQSFSHELPRRKTQSTKELCSSPGQFQCSMHHLLNYLYLYCMSNYENKGP